MPHLTLSMAQGGALIDVWITVSEPRRAALQKAGQVVPQPVKARALVETGASCMAVDKSVIQKLGLIPTGATSVLTPSSGGAGHICNQYDILLAIVDSAGSPMYVGRPCQPSSLTSPYRASKH